MAIKNIFTFFILYFIIPNLFAPHIRSVYKELHADHETGCWQQIKAEYQAPGKCEIFSLFCCLGFPKGLAPWHTTLLAKCSVLYALSALLRKCGCHRGGQGHLKRQENRTVIAWRGAASAGLVSSADRAYMNAPVPRPTPNYGTKCPRRIATLTKKQTDFSLKIEMGGKPF